jgi:hypothetical protein
MDEGPNPDENEEPGARPGLFTPSGCKMARRGPVRGANGDALSYSILDLEGRRTPQPSLMARRK